MRVPALLVLALLVPVFASASEILPLDSVVKGMKGYGVTVFEGDTSERFDVEILGVMRNIGPDQNLIIAKVDHPIVRNSGIIAGMSGSPIYIDGKVIGALAYSWQFAKDPIAGITPIEEMLRIGNSPIAGAAIAPRMDVSQFVEGMVEGKSDELFSRMLSGLKPSRAGAGTGALPIAIPISFSNSSSETIDRFGKFFEASGFLPVPSGTTSGSGKAAPGVASSFQPGDSIAGVLVTGDFSIASTGTVTHIDGDRVYAFGHPFLDMGEISFPMAKSEVITVLPNVARSFKMSNAGAIVGTLQQDRSAGILGTVGVETAMIPVELVLEGEKGPETYNLSVVRHPQLSPLLIAMAADSVVAGTQRAAGERTIVLESEILLEGHEPILLREGWSGGRAREAIPSYLAIVSSYLLSNEFSNATIEGVKIRLRHDDELKIATLTEATVIPPADGQINPGDVVQVRAMLRPYRGELFEQTFDLQIPVDQKLGAAHLFVGSGSAMTQLDFLLVPPKPTNFAQLVEVIGRLRPSTELAVGLYSPSQGSVTAGVYLPELPPTVLAVVAGDTSNAPSTPVRYFARPHLSRPMDYVIAGGLQVRLDIRPTL